MTSTIEKRMVGEYSAPDAKFITEYQRLAKKAGYKCPTTFLAETAKAQLTQFLRAENIRVYDYKQVSKFLNEQVRELQRARDLRAQRNRNNNSMNSQGFASFVATQFVAEYDYAWNWTAIHDYSKPLPIVALMTVEKILDGVGDAVAEFFVSDISRVQKPDPFLAVRASGDDEYFVVERWDEPQYRETRTKEDK